MLYRLAGGADGGYWYARWTGRRWQRHLIVRSGTLRGRIAGHVVGASIGGATLDHEDPRLVYLSDTHGTHAEIKLAFTPDGGRSWDLEALTRRSRWPNLRPTSPLGLADGVAVLWLHGHYENYQNFHMHVHRWLGRRTGDAPRAP